MHELSLVATQAQEIVEAISSVIDVHVDVVDYRLIHIAASGCYSDRLGKAMKWGTISRHVLETQKLYCVTSPSADPVCKKCPGYTGTDNCLHKACISAPIIYDGETIGTINLISYTNEQVEFIRTNVSSLKPFLKKMSEIIVTELKSKESGQANEALMAEMQTMFKSVMSGMILTDKNGNIVKINPAAIKNLRINPSEDIRGKNISYLFPSLSLDFLMSRQERNRFRLGANHTLTSLDFVANISPIYKGDLFYGNVIVFDILSEYLPLANAMISQQRNISFDSIIGDSKAMVAVKKLAKRFSQSSSTILILGESGTGKELFARAIHNESNRKDEAFVAVNCGAIPETLIESELFGYVKGAFTGASASGKIGMFEMANHGTLFLDEIGTMPIYMQAKLLRALQEHEIMRIGATKPVHIDVRVIAATNSNLSEMAERGEFRNDLYYRIAVLPIEVPSLRNRREDIIPLTEYFISKYCVLLNKSHLDYTNDFITNIISYDWPGNVRELQNVIEYAVNITTDDKKTLDASSLPASFGKNHIHSADERTLSDTDYKLNAINKLLKKYGSSTESKKRIADELGISLATLYRLLKKEKA